MGKAREVTGLVDRIKWTAWTPVPGFARVTPEVLAETLDGGQAFRWNRQPDGRWLGFFGCHVVRLFLNPAGTLEWSTPRTGTSASDTVTALTTYLDLRRDARELADSLPWRSDPHLAACIDAFPGLRILRQPFGETLLGFLCSATKQIVQIKQMLALLAARHGAPLLLDGISEREGKTCLPPHSAGLAEHGATNPAGLGDSAPRFHRLPTWPELARIPESDLRACLLGFRARYIHQTAEFLAENPGWLDETEALPYAEAKERLCSLPGVGEKVADCVLLFGAGRLEAFPVDVWIIKTMAQRYGLEGWKPAQIAHFGRVHFGPLAGLAQQYLFSYERRMGRR